MPGRGASDRTPSLAISSRPSGPDSLGSHDHRRDDPDRFETAVRRLLGAADAVSFHGPVACGGRVLSADHAPQTPQAPSEDVSAATRPSTSASIASTPHVPGIAFSFLLKGDP